MKKLIYRPALVLGLLLTAFAPGSRAQPAPPPPPPPPSPVAVATIALPVGLSPATVKQALVTSLTQRGWTVVSADDTTVVGHLLHRGIDANLTLRYGVNRVEFDNDSYKVDGAGRRTKPTVPTGWIENLEKDIPRYALQPKQP